MGLDLRSSETVSTAREYAEGFRALRRMGVLAPRVGVTHARSTARWGGTPAAAYATGARLDPDADAVIDEEGRLSYGEVHARSSAMANALADRGIGPGAKVALLCRNTGGLVLAATALAKLGADALYLNTGFAAPQMAEVLAREGASTVIHDPEFDPLVRRGAPEAQRLWTDGEPGEDGPSLDQLMATAPRAEPSPPPRPARQVILTSGTTGTPKGAKRSEPKGFLNLTSLFQRIPWTRGQVHHVPAPMFHALGNGGFHMACQLGQTLVLRRKFDPEGTLAAIADHGVQGMTAVPVMLQRILELPDDVIDRYDTSTLEIVQCSGSALPGSLAVAWMDRFGDNLYNLFASTEVGPATIATPDDLRAAPGTAGRIVAGATVRLYDDDDQPVEAAGEPGRIFVGSGLAFDGYTGGETKASIDGLLSIGDVGWFDDAGRLMVGGRDDEMIVSGGENVFPKEVEDLLADHPHVAEVAVVGVEDDQFGQRLAAHVVLTAGADLTAEDVKAYVKANLADYKAPREVAFLDELPRNPTGKILRNQLVGGAG